MSIYADLSAFGLGEMVRLVAEMRRRSESCSSAREYAQSVCELLHESFVGHGGQRQTALVRLYAGTRVSELPADERPDLPGETACLSLLGTAGTEPAWNDRAQSVGHKVLPLIDPEQVARMPMVAGLLEQLGVDVAALTSSAQDVMLPSTEGACRIFYVPDAVGSPLIPAQDFVREHGIVAAVGFGGPVIAGDVFAGVLFSKVAIPRQSAELFETVALSLGLAVLDLVRSPLAQGGPARREGVTNQAVLEARIETSAALVRAHERVSKLESDRAVFAQAQAEYDARRTASLAAVALRLGNVQRVAEIPDVLVTSGLSVLGAQGVSIALVDETRREVDIVISSVFGDEAARTYARLPLDDTLPTTRTARTGEVCLVPDTEADDLAFPAMREISREVGVRAAVSLPLQVREQLIGSLTCTWEHPRYFDASGLEVMAALAAQVAQTADRVRLLEREREHSAALQRSLLSEPPLVKDCEICVRYQPAEQAMQVGGDWYDAFAQADGGTMLVIGDVVGHDTAAAAAMSQIRALLRGAAWVGGGPAEALRHVDASIAGLGLGVTATALLVRIEPNGRICWSSAGHPPAMLADSASGVRELSAPEADLLLGVDFATERRQYDVDLAPGSTVVLCTDGLVERRGQGLDEGLERLRAALESIGSLPVDELCDALLEELRPGADDDIALLTFRWTG